MPANLPRPAVAPAAPRAPFVEMNLFDRFGRLVKSNVNAALGAMEDPEKVPTLVRGKAGNSWFSS